MSLKKSSVVTMMIFSLMAVMTPVKAQDYQVAIVQAFSGDNFRELSKHFDKRVQVTIEQQVNYYSNAQAEIIIKNFLEGLGQREFKIMHMDKQSEQGSQLYMGQLKSTRGNYRTFILFRKMGQIFVVQEVRFQKQ
jgi:ABC-type uncharacterized transport system substrate-binding protein